MRTVKSAQLPFSIGMSAESMLVSTSKQYVMELLGDEPITETALDRDIASMVAETYMPELKTMPIIVEEAVSPSSTTTTSVVSRVVSSSAGGGSYGNY